MKKGNLSFGFGAVLSGQKTSSVNSTPQLIANSTKGKFTITSPVSKFLGIAVGEHVMFVNNLDAIEAALQENGDAVQALAAEQGIDISTTEGQAQFIKANAIWAIAKGVKLYNSNGTEKQASLRLTADDKAEYIKKNGAAIAAENTDALVARLAGVDVENVTDEMREQYDMDDLIAAITPDDINLTTAAQSGSKTATSGNATGVGLQLGFTDNNIWNQLKSDLDEETRIKINRVYDVKLDEVFTTEFNNGKEVIDIKCVPVEFVSDEAPVQRIGKKNDAE